MVRHARPWRVNGITRCTAEGSDEAVALLEEAIMPFSRRETLELERGEQDDETCPHANRRWPPAGGNELRCARAVAVSHRHPGHHRQLQPGRVRCLFWPQCQSRGGFGKFLHTREPVPLDTQAVIRPTRDTLYSAAVFDLDAGPVTVTLPDAGKRFMSMQVINEDHYTPPLYYPARIHTLTNNATDPQYLNVILPT